MKVVATWSLVGTILLLSLWGFVDWPHTLLRFGLLPTTWLEKFAVPLLSCLFFHTSWGHLTGNLLFLLFFGGAIEKNKGRYFLMSLFFSAGAAASLLHVWVVSQASFVAVGASGAVAGLVSYLSIKAPRQRLYVLRLPVWFGLVVALALQLYAGWLQYHHVTQLSVFAHVGGALVGIIFARWC